MPAVSKAQFKKMHVLYRQGKITKKQLDEFTKSVEYKKLKTRKHPKKAQRRGGSRR